MKKSFCLSLTVLACCLALSACRKNDDPDIRGRYNTVIADYLYGVEYDDYSFDDCKAFFDSLYIPSDFGCSEVRRGNFVGRNLDWYINRNASAVIKINHADSHFASIGMVGCFPQFNNDVAKTGEYNEVYKYLPFKTNTAFTLESMSFPRARPHSSRQPGNTGNTVTARGTQTRPRP